MYAICLEYYLTYKCSVNISNALCLPFMVLVLLQWYLIVDSELMFAHEISCKKFAWITHSDRGVKTISWMCVPHSFKEHAEWAGYTIMGRHSCGWPLGLNCYQFLPGFVIHLGPALSLTPWHNLYLETDTPIVPIFSARVRCKEMFMGRLT